MNFWFIISLFVFIIDGDILDIFVEERLELFIKNLKEFLLEVLVLLIMFKVLEVVVRLEGIVNLLFLACIIFSGN